jgi:hypothetical protein
MQHRSSEHQHPIVYFQIRALDWSIFYLERLTGITRQSMQYTIDSDIEIKWKLEKGESYYVTM